MSKVDVVKELVDGGVTVTQACKDVGISKSMYYTRSGRTNNGSSLKILANLVYRNALMLLEDSDKCGLPYSKVVGAAFVQSMKVLLNYDSIETVKNKNDVSENIFDTVKELTEDVCESEKNENNEKWVLTDEFSNKIGEVLGTFTTSAKTTPSRVAAFRKYLEKKDLSFMKGIPERYDVRALASDVLKISKIKLKEKYSSIYCELIDCLY